MRHFICLVFQTSVGVRRWGGGEDPQKMQSPKTTQEETRILLFSSTILLQFVTVCVVQGDSSYIFH